MNNFMPEGARSLVGHFALVTLFSIWGIYNQSLDLDEASLFQKVLMEITAPIQKSITTSRNNVHDFFDHYLLLVDTSKNNVQLKSKISSLESEIFRLSEIKRENERLRELLKFGETVQQQQVLAQVVGWDSSNEFKVLRINKGKNHGIVEGSSVVTTTGLVGSIFRVSANYSDILTILDQNSRVDGIIDRTRSHGIVEGLSQFKCHLKYLSRSSPVEMGDLVVTAGLGNIYPKGIKVGTVTKIKKEENGMTQYIEVTPTVDFHKLEEVLVFTDAFNANPQTPAAQQHEDIGAKSLDQNQSGKE